jgi:putative Mg2+ transporter-C (MgtC) family protein
VLLAAAAYHVHLGVGQTILRLGVAGLLGAVIGLEREIDAKDAGLRTCTLVSAGAALFTLVSAYGFAGTADPTRIAAQIVTGIGFLGAGVIFRTGVSVRGLTTAASLWLAAGIGMAAGAGWWWAAVLATGLAVLALKPTAWLKRLLRAHVRSGADLEVRLGSASASSVLDAVAPVGPVDSVGRDGQLLLLHMQLDPGGEAEVLKRLAELEGVEQARLV